MYLLCLRVDVVNTWNLIMLNQKLKWSGVKKKQCWKKSFKNTLGTLNAVLQNRQRYWIGKIQSIRGKKQSYKINKNVSKTNAKNEKGSFGTRRTWLAIDRKLSHLAQNLLISRVVESMTRQFGLCSVQLVL